LSAAGAGVAKARAASAAVPANATRDQRRAVSPPIRMLRAFREKTAGGNAAVAAVANETQAEPASAPPPMRPAE